MSNIIKLPVGKRALSSAEFRDHVEGLSPADRAKTAESLRMLADHVNPPRANMQTFLFRSYDLIYQADEADLIRDVCLDLHKAKVKLRKTQERVLSARKQVEMLTEVEAKLGAAIVAATLSKVKR